VFQVEIYRRRFAGMYRLKGHSRRDAARVFGLSRDTIAKMCRFLVPPGYRREAAGEAEAGTLMPVIDAGV